MSTDVPEIVGGESEVYEAPNACVSCEWNSDAGDAPSPTSHCENATAGMYDIYPHANEACTGYGKRSGLPEVERLRERVKALIMYHDTCDEAMGELGLTDNLASLLPAIKAATSRVGALEEGVGQAARDLDRASHDFQDKKIKGRSLFNRITHIHWRVKQLLEDAQ